MSHRSSFLGLLAGVLVSAGCAAPNGETAAEQRAYALAVRDEALARIAAEDPELRGQIDAAPGYMLFSNFSVHPGILTFANGYGILQDNASGQQRHMRMTRFGIGPGLSVKGFYTLVIIDDPALVSQVWDGASISGGYLDASFMFGDFGGDATAMGSFHDGLRGYLFTHTGVAIEATIAFGSVSIDEDLSTRM